MPLLSRWLAVASYRDVTEVYASMGQRNLSATTCVVDNKFPLWASTPVALVTEWRVHPWGSVTDGWSGVGRLGQMASACPLVLFLQALHQREAAEAVIASGMLNLFGTCTRCSASHWCKCHSHEKIDELKASFLYYFKANISVHNYKRYTVKMTGEEIYLKGSN